LVATLLAAFAACREKTPAPQALPVRLPQVSGEIAVQGLTAPVSVTRDRWGIPHIVAESVDDLFLAQGFIQAHDRLFQMDLWRRSVQGQLSEVLGANFIERDAMTRRLQFRGDVDAEWASYGPDTKRIVRAFVRGINSWIDLNIKALPDEFRLAGWAPERWRPEDLLNRTDAFVASADAQDEIFRARLTAELGPSRVNAMLPPPGGLARPASGINLQLITYRLGDVLLRAGTRPFFAGLAAPLGTGSNAWAAPGAATDTGAPLVAVDPHRWLDVPSLRYLIHLTAPGWNVIGATAPWLPGVAIGHNEHVAWGMTAVRADVQDVYVERTNPNNFRQIDAGGRWVDMTIEREAIAVKGRSEPFEYERQYTAHGVVVGFDRQQHLAYTVRWSGAEPGTASELAALSLDQATTADAFAAALSRWKMPSAEFVFADSTEVRRQWAALVPVRRGGAGPLPVAGWTGEHEWIGWLPLTRLPNRRDRLRPVLSANGDPARTARIRDALSQPGPLTMERFTALQRDTLAWNATRIVPLLERLVLEGPVEAARARLLAWDRRVTADSAEASLYVAWEQALAAAVAAKRTSTEFARDLADRLPLVDVLTRPTSTWFDGDPVQARNLLLATTLATVVNASDRSGSEATSTRWLPAVLFSHPLGVSEEARRRFSVGPFTPGGYRSTVQAISADGKIGPAFRAVFDLSNWDRSLVVNAPGQSGWPASPHFKDFAALWAAGEYAPLVFSAAAIQANAEATLMLKPR
jgi:penicillin amidase